MTARPIRYQRQVSDRKGKIFYTSITSLSHISKVTGYQAAYVWRGHYHCGADGDSTALHTVLIRDSSSWVESLTRSLIS